MTPFEIALIALMEDVVKACEGLLHRTAHLTHDQSYNDAMKERLRERYDLLLAVTEKSRE